MGKNYNAVIIGGGFYGLRIAQFLYDDLKLKKILIIEKETDVLQRASFNNQARVHNGYHYPRSVLTALRSRATFPVFSKEYDAAIVSDFDKYYAVARSFSKVTATQFLRFFERIGSEIQADAEARKFFHPHLVEEVFKVKEHVFDASKLRKIVLDNSTKRLGIEIITGDEVKLVRKSAAGLEVITNKNTYQTKSVLNTTYSSINQINTSSKLPVIPLKHELAELCLVDMPDSLKHMAFTLMCGPFFSIMPFPAKKTYSLSHVRYTPHSEWYDQKSDVRNSHKYLETVSRISHFPQMAADVKRYLKDGDKIKYRNESLWEIKTVLPRSEEDDSRPILFRPNHGGLKNYTCIMGGKIDNIYDVFKELRLMYA